MTGCASQINKEIFSNLKNVNTIVDNNKKTQPESYTEESLKEEKLFNFPFLDKFSSNRSRAMLQIQQGCDHRCTFCIIPYGRGNSKSLEFEEINNRTSSIIKKGYSEIILTGVDLTSYGQDLPGTPKLGKILKRLLNFQPQLKRLRLSSIDPAEVDDDLMDLLSNDKRLLPHIHLSLQSGDDLILKRMKRRHNRNDVINLCKELKASRSEFTFGADVIVGFPTETDKHFLNTLNLIKSCNFSNVHVFPYSPRDGTPASRMPQVDENVKKRRADFLRKESKKILVNKLKEQIGKSTTILFESFKKSYTDGYFQVKVISPLNPKLHPKSGSLVSVNLISKQDNFLIAELA